MANEAAIPGIQRIWTVSSALLNDYLEQRFAPDPLLNVLPRLNRHDLGITVGWSPRVRKIPNDLNIIAMNGIDRKQALKRMAVTAGLLALPEITSAGLSGSRESDGYNKIKNIRGDKDPDWKTTALVIVDMQNDFVRSGAPLEVPDAIRTVPAQQALIQAFRKNKLPIIFTKFISRPHYYLLWEWSPQCQPPTKCCWKRHQRHYKDLGATRECTEIIDELLPASSDIVIEKFGYGAFHETMLNKTLQSLGITSLVITGTVTQICVEETAREAFHHGFRTTIVEEGVSSFAPDLQAATLKNFAMKFGWVSTSERIIAGVNTLTKG